MDFFCRFKQSIKICGRLRNKNPVLIIALKIAQVKCTNSGQRLDSLSVSLFTLACTVVSLAATFVPSHNAPLGRSVA